MPTLHTLLTALLLLAIPASLSAQSVSSSSQSPSRSSMPLLLNVEEVDFLDIDLRRYSDAPWDSATDTAISVLTELNVLEGNPDGTFRSEKLLNRAEFLQIVMRILPAAAGATNNLNCFPDVRADAWYATPVCRAKRLGIVQGNAREGVPMADWRFEPVRAVQYEEALKMLTELFSFSVAERALNDWYVPYLHFAQAQDLDIAGLRPGDTLTRGEMARLTASYLAFNADRLDEYRDAERSSANSVSSSSRSSVAPALRSSQRSEGGSVSSSSVSVTKVRSNILLLGELSPPLAGVQFFSSLEPVDTDVLVVTLADAAPSVSSLLLYNEDGTLLGTASRTGDTVSYRLTLSSNDFRIPQNEDRRLFVRARIAADDVGGQSGDRVQVETIRLEATGEWSDTAYAINSTDTFPVFQTANARILSIKNAGVAEAIVGPGTDQMIASFTFEGEEADTSADLRVTSLSFDLNASAHFTITAAELGIASFGERSSCTVSSNRILCESIPASIGRINESQTIRVYADLTVESMAGDRQLQLTLDEPGFPDQPGDVTWTDGATTFTWLGLERPLAVGTRWQ